MDGAMSGDALRLKELKLKLDSERQLEIDLLAKLSQDEYIQTVNNKIAAVAREERKKIAAVAKEERKKIAAVAQEERKKIAAEDERKKIAAVAEEKWKARAADDERMEKVMSAHEFKDFLRTRALMEMGSEPLSFDQIKDLLEQSRLRRVGHFLKGENQHDLLYV